MNSFIIKTLTSVFLTIAERILLNFENCGKLFVLWRGGTRPW